MSLSALTGSEQAGVEAAIGETVLGSRTDAPASAPAATRGAFARPLASLMALAGDAAALAGAGLILSGLGLADAASPVLGFAALLALVFFASSSLYPGYGIYDHEQFRRRAMASLKAALLAGALAAFLAGSLAAAIPVALLLGLALVLQPLAQQIARRAARRLGIWGEQAAILGDPEDAARVADYFSRNWQFGILPELPSEAGPSPATDSAARAGGRRIACLVGADPAMLPAIAAARQDFDEVILLADTPAFGASGLRPADVHGEIGLLIAGGGRSARRRARRRALDLAIAVPAALLAAPIVALAAAAIYAIDPGPIFFRQKREGLYGRPIEVLKLRTMYRDAEARLDALFREEPALKAEWLTHFKLRNDPRILPVVGKLLRSTSCDELPQLLNVIAGDMGIVGPRPFPEYHLLAMSAEFRRKRRSVVPGLTGLWQVSARSEADLELQRRIDEFYIDNRSAWLDWHIILRTIPAVLRRGGAY